MLPCVLFAYRETPRSATGFSLFELLYGTNPRGMLDISRNYGKMIRKMKKP